MKGKGCEQYVLEFGFAVMFLVCGKVEGACMSERWYSGFWRRKRLGTEEHVREGIRCPGSSQSCA